MDRPFQTRKHSQIAKCASLTIIELLLSPACPFSQRAGDLARLTYIDELLWNDLNITH